MKKDFDFFCRVAAGLLLVCCLLVSGCETPNDDADDVKLTAISIVKAPDKSLYSLGESLDLAGIDIQGTYDDGTVKPVSVTNANCSGFSSAGYAMSLPVTVTVDGKSVSFSVKIIGDLVGAWGDGTTVKYSLNADYTASTEFLNGGTWSIEGDTLTMTYTETRASASDAWAPTSNDPALQKWDVIVIDGKLRMSEPFYRIGTGTTLVDTWEQIAWHLDCLKVRLVVDTTGHATYSIIPKVTFDKATGVGTWDYDAMYTALTCDVTLPLPACVPGTVNAITISNSTNVGIGPNGSHPITFFSANKMDLDASAWVKMD